jgi:hypothetical protein
MIVDDEHALGHGRWPPVQGECRGVFVPPIRAGVSARVPERTRDDVLPRERAAGELRERQDHAGHDGDGRGKELCRADPALTDVAIDL